VLQHSKWNRPLISCLYSINSIPMHHSNFGRPNNIPCMLGKVLC
jgi:hypothetical protein